ncbi:MAG: chemotaxis family two-component system response regulator Rcp1 [Verrucomicrobiales bacterium]
MPDNNLWEKFSLPGSKLLYTPGVDYQLRIKRPLDILLVEDNPGDVRLMLEILREGDIPHDFNVVTDGEQALLYLRKEEHYASKPRPDIVFLDLNMPRMGGLEVLKVIKSSPELRSLPVIILTSSTSPEDIESAYTDHANCFITKPMDPDEFNHVAEIVRAFWLESVILPENRRHR